MFEKKYTEACKRLNVGKKASKKVITRCFKQQIAACHPDKYQGADPETLRMKNQTATALNEAFEIIEKYRKLKGTWRD